MRHLEHAKFDIADSNTCSFYVPFRFFFFIIRAPNVGEGENRRIITDRSSLVRSRIMVVNLWGEKKKMTVDKGESIQSGCGGRNICLEVGRGISEEFCKKKINTENFFFLCLL